MDPRSVLRVSVLPSRATSRGSSEKGRLISSELYDGRPSII
jgi:hypothetical protein